MTDRQAARSRRGGPPIKVVIVDDHMLVRSGLEAVLAAFDDIKVVEQADSGEEAVRLCREACPDVVLMDLVMPGMSGVDATQEVLKSCPEAKVIALTSFTDDGLIEATLRAGAIGYLMKNVSAHQLVDAIRAAHAGKSTLAPEATDALVRAMSGPRPTAGETLSSREREVLALMAEGLSNADIADRLVIGVTTVKTHASSVISKLGASSRTEATAIAIRRGLV
jgi:NarL family two-component system response regulator LiaR